MNASTQTDAATEIPHGRQQPLWAELGPPPAEAAPAVTGRFGPRAPRADQRLQPGDSVLLFRAIVGG